MKHDMKWENPPAPKRGRNQSTEHKLIAGKLRSRPGEWARIAEYPSAHSAYTFANRVRQGKAKAFEPAGTFEAAAQSHEGGGAVWARYVGGGTVDHWAGTTDG